MHVHLLAHVWYSLVPRPRYINWFFFFQIGSGHEIMHDTLYASRKHLYVHKLPQNGLYIEGIQQSTNLVGIVKAVIHKSCNQWSFTNCGGKGRRDVSYLNRYSHYNTYLTIWKGSAGILIKAHLMAFYTSGVKCCFIKKESPVFYRIAITVAYICDHISCNLLPGAHANHCRITLRNFYTSKPNCLPLCSPKKTSLNFLSGLLKSAEADIFYWGWLFRTMTKV